MSTEAKKPVQARMSPELIKKLDKWAAEKRWTRSQAIEYAVEQLLAAKK